MNKNEFLNELNNNLKNYLSYDKLKSNLDYYNNYIDNEINNGRKEEDVINELGSPRLIAKTILQVEGINSSDVFVSENINSNYSNKQSNNNYTDMQNKYSENYNSHFFSTNYGITCLIAFVVFLIIVLFLSKLLSAAFFTTYALTRGPIGAIIILSIIIYLMYRKNENK